MSEISGPHFARTVESANGPLIPPVHNFRDSPRDPAKRAHMAGASSTALVQRASREHTVPLAPQAIPVKCCISFLPYGLPFQGPVTQTFSYHVFHSVPQTWKPNKAVVLNVPCQLATSYIHVGVACPFNVIKEHAVNICWGHSALLRPISTSNEFLSSISASPCKNGKILQAPC